MVKVQVKVKVDVEVKVKGDVEVKVKVKGEKEVKGKVEVILSSPVLNSHHSSKLINYSLHHFLADKSGRISTQWQLLPMICSDTGYNFWPTVETKPWSSRPVTLLTNCAYGYATWLSEKLWKFFNYRIALAEVLTLLQNIIFTKHILRHIGKDLQDWSECIIMPYFVYIMQRTNLQLIMPLCL